MALATWWKADPLLNLTPLADFHIRLAEDDAELVQVNRLTLAQVVERRRAGHRPYVGYIGGQAVTYGWVATRTASIGELNLNFALPTNERYLWDFATLAEWQGQGLYPRLLQAIVQAEAAEHFWIIYAPENLPSGAGIHKAGFQSVGSLSFRQDGNVGLIPISAQAGEKASLGAARLGIPLIEDDLNPCWGCMDRVVCRCKLNPAECSCAIVVHSHA
jgi:GNAT superfamily N-acetyltransferase